MSRVLIESLGCKLNQAETEKLALKLMARGHEIAETISQADVFVLNTCSVTHIADRKSRQMLRSARRASPGAKIIATGCYARRAPADLQRLGTVDLVEASPEGEHILDAIEAMDTGGRVRTPLTGDASWQRTRTLIKIQEGCPGPCSFCVVPGTRGPARSRNPDEILSEVNARVAAGRREAVLTGTRLGDYRMNGGGSRSLAMLISRILSETGVERLRVSSVQPADLTPEFLSLFRDSRVCPHLHLPLQSGCDAVLRRMRRPYSLADYESGVARAKETITDVSITTDIVVGFPGETDAEFDQTYRFCQGLGFAGIHVFPFSPRPGTDAAAMPDRIPEQQKKGRCARMMALARDEAARFRAGFVGRTVSVLFESSAPEGCWVGHTPNYLRVCAASDHDIGGSMLPVRLIGEFTGGLKGVILAGGKNG